MRNMDSVQAGRGTVSGALLAAILFFLVSPGTAAAVSFDSSGKGFDPANLGGLPYASIDASVPFLGAGDPAASSNLDVEVTGYAEGSVCFLAAGGNVCQANADNLSGPYSALVTLQIDVVDTEDIDGPFTLILNSLGTSYNPSEVSINLNPTAPAGLDTSVLTGFDFDGSFSDFVRIEDLAKADMGIIHDYIGWTVVDGGSVTFRFDVSTSGGMRGSPEFFMNAIPVVVPEPGTALLLGLGLVGLAASRRVAPIQRTFGDELEG